MSVTEMLIERLLAKTLAERDRARELAARLEQIVSVDHELLRRALDPDWHASHASEEELGFAIAAWLIEHGSMQGAA